MMLWEEGKIGLDDPISRYIPSFAQQTVLTSFNAKDTTWESKPARRRITIRNLLTHTSGLDYPEIGSPTFRAIYAKAGLSAIGREGDVLGKSVEVLAKLPLAHEPGEKFTYGLSVDVLGRLVEVVSGMPLDQFFRNRIFEPLHMRDTWFELPADRRSRLVALHQDSAGVLRPMKDGSGLATNPDFPAHHVTYFSGGGGLSSTTADYARFLQLFINGGELDGVRLLSRKTVELMLTNQIPTIGQFGLGFALETPENDYMSPLTVGSFYWSGAFKTYYWADPKEKLVGLIFTNIYGGNVSLDTPFKTLVYSALR
jgi:CubicO group peptidase (beta-lactamase class C family)